MAATIAAQGQTQGPTFEVASVKASPPVGDSYSVWCRGGPGTDDPGLFRCQNISLTNLMTRAFNVQYDQVSGPDFLRTGFFDITAKVPAGATSDDFRAMLRNLLAERFKLAVHTETREMQVFDLLTAKGGPKLKKAAENGGSGGLHGESAVPTPPQPDKEGYPKIGGPGMVIQNGHAAMYQPKWNMDNLAGLLTGQLHRPVTNATGLDGEYEIRLYWVTESVRASAATDPGPGLEQAIQDQLGLRLVAKKGSSDIVVVDHFEKAPTEN